MIIEGTDNNTSIRFTPTFNIVGIPSETYTYNLTIGDSTVTSGQTLTNLNFDTAYAVSLSITHSSLTTHLSECEPVLNLVATAQNYDSGTGKNTGNTAASTDVAFRTHLQLFRDELQDLNSGTGQIFADSDSRRLKSNITDGIGLYIESEDSGRDRHYMTNITNNQSSTTVTFSLTMPDTPFYIKAGAYFGDMKFSITYTDGNGTRTTNTITFDDTNKRNNNPYPWSDYAITYIGVTKSGNNYTLVAYNNESDAAEHAIDIDGEVVLNVTAHEMCGRWDTGMNRCELTVPIGNRTYAAGVCNMELVPMF